MKTGFGRRTLLRPVTLLMLLAAAISAPAALADTQEIVDRDTAGNGPKSGMAGIVAAIDQTGRYVLWNGTDFCCGDANHVNDGYLLDRTTNQTEVVTKTSAGGFGNSWSQVTDMTPDARFVVFDAFANNIVPSDATFSSQDVFVRDRATNTVSLVDLDSTGRQRGQNPDPQMIASSISDDGRYVVFSSDVSLDSSHPTTTGVRNTYVRDRQLNTTKWVASGSAPRGDQGISGDGRYIVVTDNNNALSRGQVSVVDRTTGTSTLVSRNADGQPGNGDSRDPAISPDGRYVAYATHATDIVAGAGDGGHADIIRYDVQTGESIRVSVPAVDCGPGARGDNTGPQVSSDGNLVMWSGTGSDLVPNDANNAPDVFVRDIGAGRTSRVSVTLDGHEGDGRYFAMAGAFSGDGTVAGYTSDSNNLVDNDTNTVAFDPFVRTPPSAPDAPAPAAPTISVDDPAQEEGNDGTTAQTFTLKLSHGVCSGDGGPVTVHVATADDSATTANADYQSVDQTVTFDPGATTATVDVPIVGDTTYELDESYTLTLSDPSGASIAKGTGTGTIVNDDAQPDAPAVHTDPATDVTRHTATVNGGVDPEGYATSYHFEYVTDAQYQQSGFGGASVTPGGPVGSDLADHPVADALTGLAEGTTYHFRVVGDYTDGQGDPQHVVGDERTFTTDKAPVPTAHTDAVSGVGTTTATFNGTIDPNTEPTSYHYEYVTDAQYAQSGFTGASTTPGGSVGSDATDHAVADGVTGLAPDTGYHVRVVADYTVDGETRHVIANEVTFRTVKPKPTAEFSCSGDAIRLTLLGIDVGHANPADLPCRNDAVDWTHMDQDLGLTSTLGLLGAPPANHLKTGVLVANSQRTANGGSATSTVNDLALDISGVHITARTISSGAEVSCQNGQAVMSSYSRGTLLLNGAPIVDLPPLTLGLPGLVTVYINRDIRTATDVIHRAIEVEVPLLGIDLVIAEARAGIHGSC